MSRSTCRPGAFGLLDSPQRDSVFYKDLPEGDLRVSVRFASLER